MRKNYLLVLTIFICLSSTGQEIRHKLYSTKTGRVKFVSDAPLEVISAESHELNGLVDPVQRTFAFQVKVQTLKGFNSPLQQEHFYENYIEAEKYPIAYFTGKIIENVDFSVPGKHSIRAKGILNIHGVEQERIISCNLDIKKNSFVVTSTFTVPLADHNITIPRLVYHKIAEEIKVDVHAELTCENK